MTQSNQANKTSVKNPERLSGHDLVNYLIANPEAEGNFKWHTLLSCMWRNLLIAQPRFENVADFQKINLRDAVKIIHEQPQLAFRFDCKSIRWRDWLEILIKYPELATPETTEHLKGYVWSELLKKRPELAHLCPFEKFYSSDWVNLVAGQEAFFDRCPWHKLGVSDWMNLTVRKKSCLRFFRLKYVRCWEYYRMTLRDCYFGKRLPYDGMFRQEINDAATFLIYKKMDRENGKRFLKSLYDNDRNYRRLNGRKPPVDEAAEKKWDFVEEICKLAPQEAMDVDGKKYMPFYITLMAPDRVFEKLFPLFDLSERDPGGNSLLLPALLYCRYTGTKSRYAFLKKQGLDPDEKNSAGFSCNDFIKKDLRG